MPTLTWFGIALCILQSGMFSGLNLAVFGAGTLQLKALAQAGNQDAARLLELRKDSNFLRTTILWGNVGTNVLLTLLSDSVLAGALGFLFSTFVITFGGEIVPQAYFSRNALRMASLLRPVLRFWQFALFPIAKPSALILDAWLGKEGFQFLREHELREAVA
jgi:CBS domain containing-hemolysin-like protein